MTNSLAPTLKQKFWTNNGAPAAGYKVFTYAAGTDTKLDTYQSANGAANANPITLDFRGEANIWLPPNVAYKFVYASATDTDPPTSPIWTIDNVVESQLITLYGGVDTGIANAYVLNFVANFPAYSDGIVIYWIPANTNTGASTINVNGLGVVSLLDQAGAALTAGLIVANQMVTIVYQSGAFRVASVLAATGSFIGTLTGMAAPTTGTISYKIIGGICSLYSTANIFGTSNSTALQMTGLPAQVQPVSGQRNNSFAQVLDNGLTKYAAVEFSAPSTLSFALMTVSGSNLVPGGFTNSGLKGLASGWTLTYPI